MRSSLRSAPLLAAALLLAAAAQAAGLPKLPKGIALPQGGDSPGQVTFNHDTHVEASKPGSCVACHPRLFPILKSSSLPKGTITHEKMLQGQHCGACHGKGKAAFDFEDACENCHQ
jgi:c(7)-type cytochrome triheme protein